MDQIKIQRRVFQGDSFSPLLFCLALVPLTSELATSGYGYKVKKHKYYNQQSVFRLMI